MEQLETLRRKMESARDLYSVVKTMKALAAVNIREYEKAVESLHSYNRTIEYGLQIMMKNKPRQKIFSEPIHGKTGAVIFGSEQGMVGPFNDQIASFAMEKLSAQCNQEDERTALALGEKVIGKLEEYGLVVEDRFSQFGSLMNITTLVQNILIKIEEWRSQRDIKKIILFHHKPSTGTSFHPHMKYLFPLDLRWLKSLEEREWPTRILPAFNMDWADLFSSLVRQYFFVSLYQASIESLASENASRLSAMQAEEKNIQERLEEIRTQFQHQRQEAITAELLDIVSGFEVLSSPR
jgi:F-type H+-transporting ATPase subunit gamma